MPMDFEFDLTRRDMTEDQSAEDQIVLKVIQWAQDKGVSVYNMTEEQLVEAIVNKT